MFNPDGSFRLFAFTTPKGTFTLSGTNTDGTDTWKNIDTGEFHEWPRSSIKTWLQQGKIKPLEDADAFLSQEANRNGARNDHNTQTIHRLRKNHKFVNSLENGGKQQLGNYGYQYELC